MKDYTTLNYTNGAIIHDPTDQDTKSFSEHINNEVIITTAYCDIEHSDTDNKILHHCYRDQPYDTTVLINSVPLNYEIKKDDVSTSTGNLYLEFENDKGEPSGYKTVTAWQVHYWLILSGTTLYRLQAHEMYNYLDNTKCIEVTTPKYVNGKKLISSRGKIVPIKNILEKQWVKTYNISSEALSLDNLPNEYREIFKRD